MRPAFYALALMNVLFFGWVHWIDLRTPESGNDAPTVSLAREAPAVPAARAVPEARVLPVRAAAPAASAPARCLRIGPFDHAPAAATAMRELVQHGWQARERPDQTRTASGYWVYLGGIDPAAARRRALDRLHKAGLREAVVVPESNEPDRISIGILPTRAGAVRIAERVRALGFKPTLALRGSTVKRYWLDVTLRPGQSGPAVSDFPGAAARALKLSSCRPAASIATRANTG